MEDAWKYGYRYSKNFSEDIAKVLLCRFKEEIGRPFLFTETCVAKEIDMHFRGYMWAYDGSYHCPIIFSAWCFKNLNFNQNKRKNAILSACKEVDIYEADVYLNKEEALGFNYYNGINKAYINTNSDPYFNGTKRKKSTYRKEWLTFDLQQKK